MYAAHCSRPPENPPPARFELSREVHPGPYAVRPLEALSGVWVYLTELASVNEETGRLIELMAVYEKSQ